MASTIGCGGSDDTLRRNAISRDAHCGIDVPRQHLPAHPRQLEMSVRVDQTWQDRHIAEILDGAAVELPDGDDPAILDRHRPASDRRAGRSAGPRPRDI